MNRAWTTRVLACVLALGFGACDGGSSGTGITTAQGNVVSTISARRGDPERPTWLARSLRWLRFEGTANARTGVEDIGVRIEGTKLKTRTDERGQFTVRGPFAGPVGMIFELPEGGSARLVITVPRGGDLTLSNVRIDERTGIAFAESQHVRFAGLVASTDCARGTASFVSRRTPEDGRTYAVDFAAGAVRDSSGATLACAALAAGQPVDVEGEVRSDGRVEADRVEVDDEDARVSSPTNGTGDGGGERDRTGEDDGTSHEGGEGDGGGGSSGGSDGGVSGGEG